MTLEFELEHDMWWRANAVLPYWKDFQNIGERYGASTLDEPANGEVKIIYAPEGRNTDPLSDNELASAEWFFQHEAVMYKNILMSLLKTYPSLQEEYGYSESEKKEYMPDVVSIDDFKKLIGLHSIYVHQVIKNDAPYIGFHFSCNWDDEHGLGVLMHGKRVVKVGGAENAYYLWIAKEDAETP